MRAAGYVLFGAEWGLLPERQHLRELWETTPKRAGGSSVYMWFWWRGKALNQASIFLDVFCLSPETVIVMKDFSAFLDMRRFKNWAHKVSSREYLPIWRLILPIFLEHRVPRFHSPPWTPFSRYWKSAAAAAHDLILRGRWQVPVYSWQP